MRPTLQYLLGNIRHRSIESPHNTTSYPAAAIHNKRTIRPIIEFRRPVGNSCPPLCLYRTVSLRLPLCLTCSLLLVGASTDSTPSKAHSQCKGTRQILLNRVFNCSTFPSPQQVPVYLIPCPHKEEHQVCQAIEESEWYLFRLYKLSLVLPPCSTLSKRQMWKPQKQTKNNCCCCCVQAERFKKRIKRAMVSFVKTKKNKIRENGNRNQEHLASSRSVRDLG